MENKVLVIPPRHGTGLPMERAAKTNDQISGSLKAGPKVAYLIKQKWGQPAHAEVVHCPLADVRA